MNKKGVDHVGVSVVFLCHDGKGNIVLAKRSERARDEHGRWDCGGGGLELDVSVEKTLSKEILEEYGTRVLDHTFLGYRDVFREHEGVKTHWVTLDFLVRVAADEVKNNEPEKFAAVEWFRLDDLPEPLHSQLPGFLEKYAEELPG